MSDLSCLHSYLPRRLHPARKGPMQPGCLSTLCNAIALYNGSLPAGRLPCRSTPGSLMLQSRAGCTLQSPVRVDVGSSLHLCRPRSRQWRPGACGLSSTNPIPPTYVTALYPRSALCRAADRVGRGRRRASSPGAVANPIPRPIPQIFTLNHQCRYHRSRRRRRAACVWPSSCCSRRRRCARRRWSCCRSCWAASSTRPSSRPLRWCAT